MKIPAKIINFLDSNKLKYKILEHKTVYTAYDKAATLKIKPNAIGKTLVLKADPSTGSGQVGNLVLVLIPGNKNLDFSKIKKAVSDFRKKQGLKAAKKIDFISETVIKNKFKGVKIGAIPPFGGLWKMPVFTDRGMANLKKAVLSSGIHEASVEIKGSDLKKINPDTVLGSFSKPKK